MANAKLLDAASRGDIKEVEELLSHGTRTEAPGSKASTPLHEASERGHLSIVATLLAHDADVTRRDIAGRMPLHLAVVCGHMEIVKLFLSMQKLADFDGKGSGPALLSEACRIPDSHKAHAMVTELLAAGACINAKSQDGRTPLHSAIAFGHLETVKLFLSRQKLTDFDSTGLGPAILSEACGHMDPQKTRAMMTELLAAGAGINTKSQDGCTPLHSAATQDNGTAVKWLLQHSADSAARDANGWTALHTAVTRNSHQAVQLLLSNGASANLCFPDSDDDEHQGSLLYSAAKNGCVSCARVLLASGASTAYCYQGEDLPFEQAVQAGHWDMVELFLSHYKEIHTDTMEEEFWTVLSCLMRAGRSEFIERLLSCDTLSKQLSKGDVFRHIHTHITADGFYGCYWQGWKMLLPHCKDDANLMGHWMVDAAGSGQLERIELFLLNGVNIDAQNYSKMTALHVSAHNGHLGVVKKLLSCGADANIAVGAALYRYAVLEGRTAVELSCNDEVTKCLRDHMHAQQGRPVPCHLVHWYVAEMQPPMIQLEELLAMSQRVSDQERLINQNAQQVLKMQQVLIKEVTAVSVTAVSARKLDRELAELLRDRATQQHRVQTCQVSLRKAMPSTAAEQLSADKHIAEQAVLDLLVRAKTLTQRKVNLCEQRHQQKDMLSQSHGCSDAGGPVTHDNGQASVLSVEETVKRNDVQLAACRKLVLAFRATQDARAQLQKCLDKEQTLMQELDDPLQQAVTNSKQQIGSTAERLQNSNPAREKRHAEMLIRDINKQLGEARQMHQLKVHAQAAIAEAAKQEDLQRELRRKLIRAKADLEVLLLDEKQNQAARVQVEIDAVTAELATLAGKAAAAAETVSAAMEHHPELQWEQAAALLPKFGAARDLFDKDRRLRDFKVITRHGPSVREVEDLSQQKWAIKGVDSGPNAAREAERLCKLHGHPLIVPLQSTFMDADRLYLQMPFYQNGNLRNWVEQIKAARQTNGTLSPLEKAAVRSTMRQLAQAISYTHQQGIVHRDVKPENVLLQDNGNIALCDFGISKDIISNKYESTMVLSAVGTAAYCAPEAGTDAWRLHASAVDVWSFGVMLLELGAGNLYSWVAPVGQVAFQPGRLDAAVSLSREAFPADDDWFRGLWDLAMQLLDVKPQNRPSMSVALLSDFFTSDKFALDVNSTPTDRKFRTLNSYLDALRHSHKRQPGHLVRIQSEATALADMLTAFSAADVALHIEYNVSWGQAGVRKPLQEAMDIVFAQLSHQQGAAALLQQCDEPIQVFRSFLPPKAGSLSAEQTEQYEALGRILVKCLLEGIHVPLNLSAAMHCMLVHHETLSSHADICIAMLANYDPAEAQRLRQLLAANHGNGDELMMSVGSAMGSDDESMVTDANKNDVVCRKVRHYLIEDRRPALEAIAKGFRSLDLADHLEHFTGVELAALFCGEQYVDVDSLIRCFKFDDDEEQDDEEQDDEEQDDVEQNDEERDDEGHAAETKGFLETFVRSLSESSIRVFLARVTNQLSLPRTGQHITVELISDQEQPMLFPVACHMQLPSCRSYEVFANRMAVALRLGDYFARTDAQQGQRLTQAEEQAVVAAMRGEIRAGGYYRCACGYIYTVGECGGPMERAACPRCGHAIGGQQHRLEGGNEHVAFDGAQGAAWPQ